MVVGCAEAMRRRGGSVRWGHGGGGGMWGTGRAGDEGVVWMGGRWAGGGLSQEALHGFRGEGGVRLSRASKVVGRDGAGGARTDRWRGGRDPRLHESPVVRFHLPSFERVELSRGRGQTVGFPWWSREGPVELVVVGSLAMARPVRW